MHSPIQTVTGKRCRSSTSSINGSSGSLNGSKPTGSIASSGAPVKSNDALDAARLNHMKLAELTAEMDEFQELLNGYVAEIMERRATEAEKKEEEEEDRS